MVVCGMLMVRENGGAAPRAEDAIKAAKDPTNMIKLAKAFMVTGPVPERSCEQGHRLLPAVIPTWLLRSYSLPSDGPSRCYFRLIESSLETTSIFASPSNR